MKARMNSNINISVMIVGAEKAGTSALLAHLGRHPKIRIPRTSGASHAIEFGSEFPYFLTDTVNKKSNVSSILRTSLTDEYEPDRHIVVAKNVCLCTDYAAMLRLREHSPEVKVVFVMREPVARAMSSHAYQIYRGAEKEDNFSEAVKACLGGLRVSDRHTDYLRRGLYSDQIANLIEVFGRENCMFLLFDEIVGKNEHILARLYEFIGVRHSAVAVVEKVNAAKEPRSRFLAALLYRNSLPKKIIRRLLPLPLKVRVASILRRLNARTRTGPKIEIEPTLRTELRNYFEDDLIVCERLTGLNLQAVWGY